MPNVFFGFAVALEFLFLVIGIIFALQVNDWTEAWKDKIDERRFKSRLNRGDGLPI